MKTQGRKNVHGKGGVRSKAAYTASKDKAMLRNVVSQLIGSEKADEAQTTTALQKLFNVIGPRYKDRNGGYTRVLKLGNRRGDNAPIALVAFVQD